MKRDRNIELSYKREINLKSRSVAPKKGKGAKYNRQSFKKSYRNIAF